MSPLSVTRPVLQRRALILRFLFGEAQPWRLTPFTCPGNAGIIAPVGRTSNDFNREGREVGTEEVASAVIGAALAVHRELGPGLLESTYELCLAQELGSRDLGFERQHMLPVTYRDLVLPSAYRIDFLVEEQVVVEIKSVAGLEAVHLAQVLTYLKLSGCTLGLLINFNVIMLRDGIRRLVLNHQEPSRPLRFNAVGRMPG